MDTIILIYEPDELEIALQTYPPASDTQFCTLTPRAMAGCEKMGINYKALEDYGVDDEIQILKEKVHNDVLKVIQIGDKVLKSYYTTDNIVDIYISPFRASIHRLAVLLGGSQIRLHYIKYMISSTKAKKVVWFGYPASVLTEYNGNKAFSLDGSIEIALLIHGLWENIELEDLSELCINSKVSQNNILPSNTSIINNIKRILPIKNKFWLRLIRICRWSFFKAFLPYRKNILIGSSSNFILQSIPHLIDQGYGIRYEKDYSSYMNEWEDNNTKSIRDKLYLEFNKSKLFRFDGSDFIDFIFPHIEYLGTLAVPLANIAKKTKKYINNKNIACFLSIGAHRAHTFALFEGAKRAGAKIITFQHGAFGAYGDIYMEYDDVSISDHHICPGLGDQALHAKANNKYKQKCNPLGLINSNYNIVTSKSIKSTNKHERLKSKIVYVTSLYYQNVGNFMLFNTVWKDSNLYRKQKIIIEGLNKLKKENKNLDIIIKFHPRQNKHNIPHKDYLNTHNGLSFAFQTPTFNELLIKGNIIVIDTPSTTLIQSSVTKKPLFILNSHLKLLSDAKDRLVKRAVVKDDPIELMKSLQEFIINGVYPADLNNNEFSSYYSDPFGDGNLYNRISEFIAQTCE